MSGGLKDNGKVDPSHIHVEDEQWRLRWTRARKRATFSRQGIETTTASSAHEQSRKRVSRYEGHERHSQAGDREVGLPDCRVV